MIKRKDKQTRAYNWLACNMRILKGQFDININQNVDAPAYRAPKTGDTDNITSSVWVPSTQVICRRRPAGYGHVPQPYISAVTPVPAGAATFLPVIATTIIQTVAATTNVEEASILAIGSDENFARRLPPTDIGVQDSSDIWDPAATSGDFGFKEPPLSDPEQTGFSVQSQAALVDLGGLGGHAPAVTMFTAPCHDHHASIAERVAELERFTGDSGSLNVSVDEVLLQYHHDIGDLTIDVDMIKDHIYRISGMHRSEFRRKWGDYMVPPGGYLAAAAQRL